MILTEDAPLLQGYDQDAWAQTFRYREVDWETALDQVRGLRAANFPVLRGAGSAQMERVGLHSNLVHRRQIDRILGAITSSA